MAAYNDSYSLPRQPVPSNPISIVDILFPGFTNISSAIQQLQVGDSNGYARILCISGIVVLLGKYAYKYLKAFVETYFSSWCPNH
jgi:chaperone BCS1